MSDKLKGVWVDGGVWEHEPFSLLEKHLFQKISDLDNENGCTAMNKWFADFLGCSKSRVSQLISGFKKSNLISVELKYNGLEIVGRVINLKQGGVFLIKEGMFQENTPVSYKTGAPLAGSEESNLILLSNLVKEYKEREAKTLAQINNLQSQLKKANAEILDLKNQSEEKEKSSAKKESKPVHTFPDNEPLKKYIVQPFKSEGMSKPYEIFINNFKFEGWTHELKEAFILYCEVKDDNGRFGATQVKMRIREITQALEKHEVKKITSLIGQAANGSWADFQFDKRIIEREQKAKKDEQKQSANNGKSIYENYAESIGLNLNEGSNGAADADWSEA